MLSFLVAVGLLAVGESKSWKFANNTSAMTLVGVGAESDVRAVAGAAQNGYGASVMRYDGNIWSHEKGEGAGLLLDAAVGSKYTVATSIFPIIVSTNDGASYNTVDSLGGASQSAHVSSTGVISLVGSFLVPVTDYKPDQVYGVARSVDGGESWRVSRIAEGYCRYGSFPSDNVWYVANGMWGSDPTAPMSARVFQHSFNVDRQMDNAARSLQPYPISSRITMGGIGSGGFKIHTHERTNVEVVRLRRILEEGSHEDGSSGWFGSISKTVDGGRTWSTVFASNPKTDFFYFNNIACSSETHCVAVAEGDDAATGGSTILAFVTFDGGITWENTLQSVDPNVVSIMAAAWVSDSEGWLGATMKDRNKLSAVFYHTVDGGKTFTVGQTLDDCFVMDMDFGGDVGFVSCVSSSGSSARVAMYI
jgi:hypothetical protein